MSVFLTNIIKENIMSDNLDFTPDIFTLTDEEGNEQSFEILDTLELDDENYYALTPFFESPEDMLADSGEFVILKAVTVDGEEMLSSLDDEDELDRVGAIFLERFEEMFNEELDEDE